MIIYYDADGWQFADELPEGAVAVPSELYVSLMGKVCEAGPDGLPRATTAQRRADLADAVTAKRWQIETGGITLPNGIHLDTGREDQAAVANAIAVWPFTGLTSISFKAASGFVTLDFDSLKLIAAAIGMHKQACYAAERDRLQVLAALADADLGTFDIGAGWPTGTLTALQMAQLGGQ